MKDLSILVKYFEEEINKRTVVSIFHTIFSINITLNTYLLRLAKQLELTESDFLFVLIYLDRIANVPINGCTIHRLFLALVTILTKFHRDDPPTMQYLAKVGGVGVKELCRLEIEILRNINFSLFITKDDYEEYREKFVAQVAQY